MTQGFYDLVMSLLSMADEVAADAAGHKAKPYLYLGSVQSTPLILKSKIKKPLKKFIKESREMI